MPRKLAAQTERYDNSRECSGMFSMMNINTPTTAAHPLTRTAIEANRCPRSSRPGAIRSRTNAAANMHKTAGITRKNPNAVTSAAQNTTIAARLVPVGC